MGLLSAFTGAASEVKLDSVHAEVGPFLAPGEHLMRAFKLVRDLFIFTNARLILIDKQGITGKKQEWTFLPYKSIVRYSLETAGHFDMDAELRIWVSGSPEPIKREFHKDGAVKDVCKLLAVATLSGQLKETPVPPPMR